MNYFSLLYKAPIIISQTCKRVRFHGSVFHGSVFSRLAGKKKYKRNCEKMRREEKKKRRRREEEEREKEERGGCCFVWFEDSG